ncbi:GNAT family acetyltransferase [Hymenobacter sp. DG25B]|uniref:GNAT family N-acetyltransferase n=1 Tax=Hymenobacter sp. DG25B TaxID=1385664 RepID=UPI000540D1EC|nr:GNAT family N-acetyltransferase [Hymenobacter sp. DG25B]AIZ63467.1 GNAT family acetyltransferase [Hymenobacter sp. DG25B]
MKAYPITTPEDRATAFAIREKVFVEEQGVPRTDEHDAHDEQDARHYLVVSEEGTPCGAARWRTTENGVKLERFAVLNAFRNRAAGSAILQRVLEDVQQQHPDATVYLNAQLRAVPFYERHGFQKVGEKFTECDIEHYKMEWQRPGM